MAEWFKALVLKISVLCNIIGSNPILSVNKVKYKMLILIILLPFLACLSGLFFGKYIGRGVSFLTISSVILIFCISFFVFFDIISTGVVYKLKILPWIFSDSFKIYWCFCFDSLTVLMLLVVSFISSLVHIYSIEYMKEDPHLNRFMSYLSLFTFFMIILVTSNTFLQLFVGWEGVGVSSFLLINFWYTRIQANKASIKAMVLNRVGDFFFLLALFCLFILTDSLDFDVIFGLLPNICNVNIQILSYDFKILDLICLFLFLGATGKSAQIGLHAWLPDAMEGPTPVSALIHAATMVTAGVFLLIRCSFLFEYSPNILIFIILIGSITSIFAATTGLFQNDLKRVIAYSTCSQLGYMFFACGMSGYEIGLFHLSNHAFFKALLFLGAGSVIHALADEQDMRKMGGLRKILPFSYSVMLIGSLALIGFPFLSGFYSKDIILEIAYAKYEIFSHFAFVLGVLAVFCTAFYSTRVLILVFLINSNGIRQKIFGAHEGSNYFVFVLTVLVLCSISVGYLTKDLIIGFGTNFWLNVIFILPQNYFLTDVEFIPLFIKLIPLFFTLSGIFFSCYIYFFHLELLFLLKQHLVYKQIYFFFNSKWYFDKLYMFLVGLPILNLSYLYTYKDIDRGLLEKVGPSGLINLVDKSSFNLKLIQTGYVYHYMLITFFIFSLVFLFLILFNYYLISPIFFSLIIFLFLFSIFIS